MNDNSVATTIKANIKPKADHYCSASSAKIPLVLAKPDTVFRLIFRHRHYQSNDSGSSTCVVDHHLFSSTIYHPNFTSMLSNVCKYWQAWLSPQYHNTQRNLLAAHQMVVHVWNQHCDSEWSDLFTLFSSKHCFFKLQDTMKQLLPVKQAAWMTTQLRQLSKPTSSQKQITIAVQAVQKFHLSWQSLTQSSDSYFVTDITRAMTPDLAHVLLIIIWLFSSTIYHPNFTSMLSNVCKYWQAWLSPQYHNTQRNLLAAHQMVVHVWNQHCDSEWSDLFTLFSSKHCFFKLQDTMKQLLPVKQAAWMTTQLRQLSKPTSSQKQITIAVQAVQKFHLSWQSLTQSSDSYFVTDITRAMTPDLAHVLLIIICICCVGQDMSIQRCCREDKMPQEEEGSTKKNATFYLF